MRYEGFTTSDRSDEILDKIKKYGISSISPEEKHFLDSHANNSQDEVHKKLTQIENEVVFEDDNGYFRFELTEVKKIGDSQQLIGVFYVPDMKDGDGIDYDGRLEGQITVHTSGEVTADFSKGGWDIFDFCEGLEHELDQFIDYVVGEVDDTTSSKNNY
jgi:hypothetical protein